MNRLFFVNNDLLENKVIFLKEDNCFIVKNIL